MIRLLQGKDTALRRHVEKSELAALAGEAIWIDLNLPDAEETALVEQVFTIKFPTLSERQEIEISAKIEEYEDHLILNSNFLRASGDNGFILTPATFVLKGNVLLTLRTEELRSFAETEARISANPKALTSGIDVFLLIFGIRVELDADLIESLSKEISTLGRSIALEGSSDGERLIRITHFQETMMQVRDSLTDKNRVLSALLKRTVNSRKAYVERIRILLKDVQGLTQSTEFMFERLEYLQNTFLGIVNIEQNKIIKQFTVATVIFMPPTLLASLWGMNFKRMPELDWPFGYPVALVLLVLSSVMTWLFFKRKRWL